MFDRLKTLRGKIKQEIKIYRLVLRDSRTPKPAKLLLLLAVGYAVSPLDIIPDFIPVIGYLDDAVVLPLLVIIAAKMIPKEVIEDCRKMANRI